jgi:regulator of protease activity HflC (stomatin/prohibitin superfamily)
MKNIILYCIGGTLALLLILAAIPQYNVYQQTLNGKAQLQSAEYTRQTRVLEAKAKAESAALEGEAIIIRAKAQATANELISKSLTPEVLQYQFLEVLNEQGLQGDRTVIYIPTDANSGVPVGLPLPEANRLK